MYRLWYMARMCARMDAVGTTWMAVPVCALHAMPSRRTASDGQCLATRQAGEGISRLARGS
jgi:hypothetical protein